MRTSGMERMATNNRRGWSKRGKMTRTQPRKSSLIRSGHRFIGGNHNHPPRTAHAGESSHVHFPNASSCTEPRGGRRGDACVSVGVLQDVGTSDCWYQNKEMRVPTLALLFTFRHGLFVSLVKRGHLRPGRR